jgi:hypothetical protein
VKEMEGTAHVDLKLNYLDHLCLRKDFDIILTSKTGLPKFSVKL